MKVLVVLVNWKRAADTILCINSLLNSQFKNITIAVVDNASPDGSFEKINAHITSMAISAGDVHRLVKSGDSVSYICNQEQTIYSVRSDRNLGFAGGNNFAYRRAIEVFGNIFSHTWFLNNDTEQDGACLPAMLKRFSSKTNKIGIVGSTMLYDFDRKTVQAFGGSRYRPFTGLMQEIGNGQTWPCPVDEAQVEAQMSYVCGASMLVSSQLIRDVGLMTEDYFIFFEEIDWCQRAKRAGYSLAYAHDAIVYHKEGASIGTGTGAKRSLLAEYYGLRNKLLVTWRFFPWAMPSVWLISWLQAARRLAQRRPRNAWLMARVLLGIGQRPS